MENPFEDVIEAMRTGKSIIEIIRELRGKKISAEERWYIDRLLSDYQLERQTQELKQAYREGTERIVAKIGNLEKHLDGKFNELGGKFDRLYESLSGFERNVSNYIRELGGIVKGVMIRREVEKK